MENGKYLLGKHNSKENITISQIRFQKSISSEEISKSKWTVKNTFRGKHFERLDDINFCSLAVNFTYLEEWLATIPFKPEIPNEVGQYILKYDPPNIREFQVYSLNSKLQIYYILNRKFEIFSQELVAKSFIKIIPQEKKVLNGLKRFCKIYNIF